MEEQVKHNEDSAAEAEEPAIDDSNPPAEDDRLEEESDDLQRRGDVEKCPICGSHVDADAYHCSSCRNYFCFHCRARLVPPDQHLQCVNQNCDYYGKLVCEVCDVAHEKDEAPTVYQEPEDGYWPGWLLLSLLAFGLIWYFSSLQAAVWGSIAMFVAGGLVLQFAGANIFGKQRVVEHQRKSIYHSCIRCGDVVKEVRQQTEKAV